MADPIYAHPRLAAVYDAFDGPRVDLMAYLAIAEELHATSVVDVGCGTGSLPLLLSAHGLRVTAVDPAAASLEVAKAKPGTALVTWLHGVAADLPQDGADLAVMTGNAAQAVVDDDDWAQTLLAVRSALRPGGVLAFETRQPEARAWEQWAVEAGTERLDVPGIGLVEQDFAVTEVAMPYVGFRYVYRFPDGVEVASDSVIRFRSQAEVERDLSAAGFAVREVREAPDRPGLELVFLAERS